MAVGTNHLAGEVSPYLRQHAGNPVDWYPWGPSALERARREDKPILLSIGYSACHWCHVMAHESFENEAVAAVMNRHYVCIKVDREERPDLDHLYQTVCQLLTQTGGWPLTVFLTPSQEPFFAGTYFAPDRRYGRPGFIEVLEALAEAYRDARAQVTEQAQQIIAALACEQAPHGQPGELTERLLDDGYAQLRQAFDTARGGFGQAPKFPNPGPLEVFCRHHARTGQADALQQVVKAARAMRAGGIYDQLGFGFHRYSVDAAWRVPHFEKMLYDNVLLPPLYLAAWQASGQPDLAECAVETLDYLLASLRAPEGGFYSATDADSSGEEGRYFVWTADQVRSVLEATLADIACERFGVTAAGNSDGGASVLHLARPLEPMAAARGWPPEQMRAALEQARRDLLAARARREAPHRDEQVIAAWNGLAIRAYAQAGLLLGREAYLRAAEEAARFVLDHLVDDGRLRRIWAAGEARGRAFLDDHAAVAAGLLELFAATGEPRWYDAAVRLTETVAGEYTDPAVGDWFMTSAAGEALVLRPKETGDGATPSGLSLMVHNLWRLHQLSGEHRYRADAERALRAHAEGLRRNPWGWATLLCGLDALLSADETVVVVGDGPAAEALVRAALADYRPNRLVCRRRADTVDAALPWLLRGHGLRDGQPAAYLCRGQVCQAAVTSPEGLRATQGTSL